MRPLPVVAALALLAAGAPALAQGPCTVEPWRVECHVEPEAWAVVDVTRCTVAPTCTGDYDPSFRITTYVCSKSPAHVTLAWSRSGLVGFPVETPLVAAPLRAGSACAYELTYPVLSRGAAWDDVRPVCVAASASVVALGGGADPGQDWLCVD